MIQLQILRPQTENETDLPNSIKLLCMLLDKFWRVLQAHCILGTRTEFHDTEYWNQVKHFLFLSVWVFTVCKSWKTHTYTLNTDQPEKMARCKNYYALPNSPWESRQQGIIQTKSFYLLKMKSNIYVILLFHYCSLFNTIQLCNI